MWLPSGVGQLSLTVMSNEGHLIERKDLFWPRISKVLTVLIHGQVMLLLRAPVRVDRDTLYESLSWSGNGHLPRSKGTGAPGSPFKGMLPAT